MRLPSIRTGPSLTFLGLGLLAGGLALGLGVPTAASSNGGGAIAGVLIGLVMGWCILRWARPHWLRAGDWVAFCVLVAVLSYAGAFLIQVLTSLLPSAWGVPKNDYTGVALLLLWVGGAVFGSLILGLAGGPWVRGWIQRAAYPNTFWGHLAPRLGPDGVEEIARSDAWLTTLCFAVPLVSCFTMALFLP